MKVTTIIVCHERFEKFEEVLRGWLSQSEIDEIIVLDNSGLFKTNLPVHVVNSNKNLGPQGKYPLALWAKNEWVIFADDDILVKEGLVRDLIKYKGENRIVGIIGRIFNGSSYYTSTGYRGENITEPIKVDWLGGGCTLAPRNTGKVIINKCPAMEIDDWWWETQNPEYSLYVIPTNKYYFIPQYLKGLHSTQKCKELREKFYELYSKNK